MKTKRNEKSATKRRSDGETAETKVSAQQRSGGKTSSHSDGRPSRTKKRR